MKNELSAILYAEHQGDVNRALHRLAPLLGLPEPVWDSSDYAGENPEIWPWDKEEDED